MRFAEDWFEQSIAEHHEFPAVWFIALERVCQQQLLVEALGVKPTFVTPERARYSREHVGSPFIGFQTLYDQLVATQPDMFD